MLEYVFTFLEALFIFLIVTQASAPRFHGSKGVVLLVLSALAESLIVTLLAPLPAFLVLALSFLLDAVIALLLADGPLSSRLCGLILAYFVLHSIGYIIGFSMAFLLGEGSSVFFGFRRLIVAGTYRTLYLCVDKTVMLVLFLLLRKYLGRIRLLQPHHQWALFFMLLLAYGMATLLMQMFITDYHVMMQRAVLLSLIFILTSMLTMTAVLNTTVRYHEEKSTRILTQNMNALMQKNYLQMAESLKLRSRQTHDFKNHLNTIRGLSEDPAVIHYLDSISRSLGQYTPLCSSGNRYVDAVINCKAAEAGTQQIPFTYLVELADPLNIPPVDICTILANQIDNAMEACLRIPDPSRRQVEVHIYQQQTFTFFRVENTILSHSVSSEDLLSSRKTVSDQTHGLGLINIRQAAERNRGSLQSQIEEDRFISIVMVQNTTPTDDPTS